MAYKDFHPGDQVQHRHTKRRGQVAKNHLEVCRPKKGQVAVIYDGDDEVTCVPWQDLIREVN